MTVTIVICTRGRPYELNRCLSAVSKLSYPSYSVLVLDNAPSDDRARVLAEHWQTFYLISPVPGLSRARNVGARACTSDLVAFLDDDAVPEPEWLSELVSGFVDPQTAVVTSRITPLREHGRRSDDEGEGEGMRGGLRILDRTNPRWFTWANFGGIGDGIMAFRRKTFDVWPGFNERLGRGVALCGGEEHFAFSQLIAQGYAVAHSPRSVVQHPTPANAEDLVTRSLYDISASVGYVMFLFFETQHKAEVLRFLFEAISRTRRPWAFQPADPLPCKLPLWRGVAACVRGCGLYLRSLLGNRHLPAVPSHAVKELSPVSPGANGLASRLRKNGWFGVSAPRARKTFLTQTVSRNRTTWP